MKYLFGRRNFKKDKYGCNWELLDIGSYKVDKPIVLCLGGNCTIDERDANAMARSAQRLIGETDAVDFLSIAYSHSGAFKAGYLATSEIIEIVDKLFLPLLLSEKCCPLPVEQACKNMRKVNILAHCFGAREIVPDIEKQLLSRLFFLGYDETEAKKIAGQIFVAGFVGGKRNTYTSSFLVKSVNDRFYGSEYAMELITQKLDYVDMGNKDKVRLFHLFHAVTKDIDKMTETCEKFLRLHEYMLVRKGKNINLFTAKLTKCNGDHEITAIDRDKDWKAGYEVTKRGDIISQTLGYALASAVANSLTNCEREVFLPLDMKEMKEECESLLIDLRDKKLNKNKKPKAEVVAVVKSDGTAKLF